MKKIIGRGSLKKGLSKRGAKCFKKEEKNTLKTNQKESGCGYQGESAHKPKG